MESIVNNIFELISELTVTRMLPIFAIKLGGGAWSSSIGMNFFAVGLVVGLVVGLRVVGLELGRFDGDEVLNSFDEPSLIAAFVGSRVCCSNIGFLLGTEVSLMVVTFTFSVGCRDGCGVVGIVGSFVGGFVGFGDGRHVVNAIHFIVGSEHSVYCPDMHGLKQFFVTSFQSFPHQ